MANTTINKAVQKDRIIGAILLVLALATSYFLVIKPATNEEATLAQKTVESTTQLETLKAEEQSLRTQQNAVGEQQALAEQLSQKFPPTANVADITAMIGEVAAASGVTLVNVSVSTPAPLASTQNNPEGAAPAPSPTTAPEGTQTPPPAPAPPAPASGLGGEIYQMDIQITVENADLNRTGLFISNLENARRTVYTRSVSATEQPPAAGLTQQLQTFTFLLPPLNIQPPPPIS